jgi:hypothetical protein
MYADPQSGQTTPRLIPVAGGRVRPPPPGPAAAPLLLGKVAFPRLGRVGWEQRRDLTAVLGQHHRLGLDSLDQPRQVRPRLPDPARLHKRLCTQLDRPGRKMTLLRLNFQG